MSHNPALFAAGAACLVAALMVLAIQRRQVAAQIAAWIRQPAL